MHSAHEQAALIDGLLLIIIFAYLGIAYQFWTRRRSARGGATRALGQLVIIFVFCAFCGYLPRLVEIPEMALVGAHIVLATAAWAYFFSGQVDRLSVAVDRADRDTREAGEEMSLALDTETEACARLAEQSGAATVARQLRERLRRRQTLVETTAAPL